MTQRYTASADTGACCTWLSRNFARSRNSFQSNAMFRSLAPEVGRHDEPASALAQIGLKGLPHGIDSLCGGGVISGKLHAERQIGIVEFRIPIDLKRQVRALAKLGQRTFANTRHKRHQVRVLSQV